MPRKAFGSSSYERALTSTLPPLADPRAAARAVAGFGPLQSHLDDPTVEEIYEPGRSARGVRVSQDASATAVRGEVSVT